MVSTVWLTVSTYKISSWTCWNVQHWGCCYIVIGLYASETWTLLKADIAKLEVFHMTNQRRILGILWYESVTNVEVSTLSQLSSINEAISRRRHSLFGHVARMDSVAPAHQALHLSVTSRQGSGQFDTWRRQPGRPRKCWVEQVTTSTGLSFWCLECCDGSVSMEGATTRRRSSVRERKREREGERERERCTPQFRCQIVANTAPVNHRL